MRCPARPRQEVLRRNGKGRLLGPWAGPVCSGARRSRNRPPSRSRTRRSGAARSSRAGRTSGELRKWRPAGATNQTAGVVNLRGRLGSRTRSTRTPTDTITKARRVPIEQRLPASRTVNTAEKNATPMPVTMEVIQGVRKRGCTRLTTGGKQAVAGHAVEHAGLAQEHDQNHRGQAGDGAELDELAHPAHARAVGGHGNRVRHVQLRVRHNAGGNAPRPGCRARCRSAGSR